MAEIDDEVFKALADPSRRLLLDSLNARNGQSLHELCAGLSMARQSVSKHLAVLEAANVVTTVWRGREKLHYLNAEPINAIADRWIHKYHRARVQTLADLKTALEAEPMSNSTDFVYTTYIRCPNLFRAAGRSSSQILKAALNRRERVVNSVPTGTVTPPDAYRAAVSVGGRTARQAELRYRKLEGRRK
jgi:DNA-binding transcriptional ArsR family regulator